MEWNESQTQGSRKKTNVKKGLRRLTRSWIWVRWDDLTSKRSRARINNRLASWLGYRWNNRWANRWANGWSIRQGILWTHRRRHSRDWDRFWRWGFWWQKGKKSLREDYKKKRCHPSLWRCSNGLWPFCSLLGKSRDERIDRACPLIAWPIGSWWSFELYEWMINYYN